MPVNADLERCFVDDPAGVAETIALAAASGIDGISVGSAMSRTAYGALMDAAREVQEQDTFTFASTAAPFSKLNEIFSA